MYGPRLKNCVFNATFSNGEYSQFNACVGENGNPQQDIYAEGFIDASIQLCKLVIEDETHHSVDAYIYPIAFNMRHGVELWLKLFIMQLDHIHFEKPIGNINLGSTHDLNVLWGYFKVNALLKDVRYQEPIDELEDYINDIGEIDPTAQTFRYPYSNESVKHLVNTPLINILVLFIRLTELKEKLEKLRLLSGYLIEEYGTGSYTSKLNREQLLELAEFLPDYNTWRDSDFKDIKEKAKLQFGLSSNDLTKAINIIKAHYLFAAKIGITLPLKHAKQVDIEIFLQAWELYHSGDGSQKIADETILQRKEQALLTVVTSLSIEVIADLIALYEMRSVSFFSESYHFVFNRELEAAKAEINNDRAYRDHVRHYLRKTIMPQNILFSLLVLQQHRMINELETKFQCIRNSLSEFKEDKDES